MLFKKLTLTGVIVCWVGPGFTQVSDNFSDGDFTVAPPWTGSTAYLVNAAHQLQLNNTIAATTYLSTPSVMSSLDHTEWDIYVRQAFAPSGSNFGRIYLVSDQANLIGPLNGYYLQLGEAGSLDAIELFRQDGTGTTSVCRGSDGNISAAFSVRIKVLRDSAGLWQLYTDYSGGTAYVLEASGTDSTYTSSAFFGILAMYTISNDTKFYYDDIYAGPFIIDSLSPTLISAVPVSAHSLDVTYSEPVDSLSAQVTSNYVVNAGIGSPATVVRDSIQPKLVHLTFTTAFANFTNYELIVDNVTDVLANALDHDTIDFLYFASDTALFRDIVINEMLVDENPQVGLPAAEFVEIYNRSSKIFDLTGWTLSDGTSTAVFGSKILLPHQYLILCAHADTTDYQFFGSTLGLSSFPTLNNTGDDIILKNPLGTLVDEVNYDVSWYKNPLKANGGYTLEQINPDALCLNVSNWAASNDASGGTPGTVNSIYNNVPDTVAPYITGYTLNSGTQITLQFSEPIDLSAIGGFGFSLSGGIGISFFNVMGTPLEQIVVNFVTPVDTGITYALTVTGIADCSGNGIGFSQEVDFLLTFQAQAGDLVLNEVLFDPPTGASDFVEVYNNSSKTINLQNWTLANIDHDTIGNPKIISASELLFYPGQYLAFTSDKAALVSHYPSIAADRIIEIPALPTYDNDSGTVILLNTVDHTIDRFHYDAHMHFALLNSVDGVSLERLDFNRPTNETGNWHSAAQEAGFATPGEQNSQYNPNGTNGGVLTLGGEIFSPDNDGYQDVMNFSYAFSEAGYTGSATLYDAHGREIKKLVRNELLGTTGTFTWDGITDKTEKAPIGVYVLYFEYFNLAGAVKKIKKSFVLAGKF